jgi:asparagine synthase (glutamine-hydrolysing)
MCGLAGFVDFKAQTTESVLQQMTETLNHRGPDGSGTAMFPFESPNVVIGLGHRRLAIIDLSTGGSQPKQFNNKWHVVFNGEIYNFKEIRTELEKKNYQFDSQSDTEVLLKAFDCWGTDAVNYFNGMFAFALLNSEDKKLYLVRDRAGVKPLYIYQKDHLLLFASELKAFHKHPSFNPQICHNSVSTFFTYGYILAPFTIFENTSKLEPGSYLEIDLVNKSNKFHQYWSASKIFASAKAICTQKNDYDENEIINETERLLKSACEYRMLADVPVGMFLSGGYDSSLVTALLQSSRTTKLKTFSIGFDKKGFDEAPFAKKVASYLGTDHTEYYCTPANAEELLEDLPYFYDEPFADSSAIPTMLVSKLARKHVTVALSADAGDEVFAGYGKYTQVNSILNKTSKVPAILRRGTSKILGQIDPQQLSFLHKYNDFTNRFGKITELITQNTEASMLATLAQVLPLREQKRLLTHPFTSQENWFNKAHSIKGIDGINAMLALDYLTYLPDDILVKVDRATMSVGLEGREPLLDHRVLEWAATLPANLKMKNGVPKYILKQITNKYIPKAIMDRPKMGFTMPIQFWFKESLSNTLEDYINENELNHHGLLNTKLAIKQKNDFIKGKPINISAIWNLLMFQMWYKKWMR